MITFGTHLLAALLAGFLAWCVSWLCNKLGALVYLFWLLQTVPIVIGQ